MASYLLNWVKYFLKRPTVCTSPNHPRLLEILHYFFNIFELYHTSVIYSCVAVDRDELHLLYKNFYAIAPDNQLSQEQFAVHFSPFSRSPLLVKSLFNAIDR